MSLTFDGEKGIYNKDGEELSIFPLILENVMVAIAINDTLQQDINEEYSKNEGEYFRALQESGYLKNSFFNSHLAEQIVQIRKVASMYYYHSQQTTDGGHEFIIRYLKKGYNRVVSYIENRSKVHLGEFMNYIEQFGFISDTKTQLLVAILMYIDYEKVFKDPQFFKIQIENLLSSHNYGSRGNELDDERAKNTFPAMAKFEEIFGFKMPKQMNFEEMISKQNNYHVGKLPKAERNKYLRTTNQDIIYKIGLTRYEKPLTAVLRSYGINDWNITPYIDFTRDEIINIYTLFDLSAQKERLKEDEFEFYMMSALFLASMSKLYLGLGEKYIENFNEKEKAELSDLEIELRNKISEVESSKIFYEKQLEQSKNKIDEQEKKIRELERQLKDKEEDSKEIDLMKMELISLRNYTYVGSMLDSTEFVEENLDKELYKKRINLLKSKKIAVIGGHNSWHRKIKEVLPNVRFVHPDEQNISMSFIKNMDIVCFETSYTNHTVRNRAMTEINKDTTKIIHFNESRNIHFVIMELCEILEVKI
jgi:hypothetical protein